MKQAKTEQFLVNHLKGVFPIFISRIDEKHFIGHLRYHGGPVREKDLSVTRFGLKGKNFSKSTAEDVLKDCTAWIKENLGKEFTIEKLN